VKLVVSKPMMIGAAVFAMTALLIYNLPFILLGEATLTKEVGWKLQRKLQQYGLNCKVAKVRWIGGGRFTADGIMINERQSGELLVKADHLEIRTDFLAWLRNPKNPETVLQELEIIRPQFHLVHFPDQTWNISRFLGKGKRQLKLSYRIKIRDGRGTLDDYKYGKHRFFNVNGVVDLQEYPLLTWSFKGGTDFGKQTTWVSDGKVRSDQAAGETTVRIDQAPLPKVFEVLQKNFVFKARSGLGCGRLRFAWNKKKVWLQDGAVQINRGVVKFPWFDHEVQIKAADSDFTPEQVVINSSLLNYQKSQLRLAGRLDIVKFGINAQLKSSRARVEDLLELFPAIPNTVITGRANLDLEIGGLIKRPVFDGKITLGQTEAVVNEESFTAINGVLYLKKNNIRVPGLKGVWHGAPIVAVGTVNDIYNPRLNLDIDSQGINLEELRLCQMGQPDLRVGHSGDLSGKLTGHWDTPLLTGKARLEHASFRNVSIQDVTIGFTWEPMVNRVKALSLNGKIWGGVLAVTGVALFDATGVKWNLSGKVSDVNTEAINLLPETGLKLNRLTAEALLKGAWRYGAPFDPGLIMGVVRGNDLTYLNTKADEVSAVYSWNNNVFTMDSLQIKLGEGRLFGYLTLDRTVLSTNLSAENIRLGHLIAKEQNLAGLDGVFKGNLLFEGELADLRGKISGTLTDLSWDKKGIGTIHGELEYGQRHKELIFRNLTVNSCFGDCQAQGKIGFTAAVPEITAQLESSNLNLKEVVNWLPGTPQIALDGTGRLGLTISGNLSNPDFNCTLNMVAPQLNGVTINTGLLECQGNLNQVQINKCELVSNNVRLALKGGVTREKLDLTIVGDCDSLESLQLYYRGNLLKGSLELDGKLMGSLAGPLLAAKLNGSEISFGELRYPNLTACVKWVGPELQIYNTQLSNGDSWISANGKIHTVRPYRSELAFEVKNFQIKKLLQLAKIANVPADGRFSGAITMTGVFPNPQIRLGGQITEGIINSVPVNGEVVLSYGDERLWIEKIGLHHSSGTFYANGIWEKGKTLRLTGKLNEFPLQTVNPWLTSTGLALTGLANANVKLEWLGSEFNCDYQLESAELRVNNDNWGSTLFSGAMNEDGLNINQGILNIKNGSLGVFGFIPWSEQIRAHFQTPNTALKAAPPVNLRLAIKNVPAELFNAYAAGFTIGGGEFNGNLRITGSFSHPEFTGKLEYFNGKLDFPELPLQVEAIQAAMTISRNQMIIDNKATGNIGKGRIVLTGKVDFNDFNKIIFDLGAEGNKVFYKNFGYGGYADFTLNLAGPFDEALLMGNIIVYDAKIGGIGIGGANKNQQKIWDPKLDLTVKMDKKVRYRQIGVADVSLKGALHIKGSFMEPLLGGELTTNQGVVTFYSQTFKVDRGQAVFSYTPGFNPYVDIEASLLKQKTRIFLKMKGQAGTEIIPVLSAQPALSQKEIFALLNWSDLTGDEPLTVDNVLGGNMSMVTDTLFGDVLYQIRDTVGVDYLYLETDYRSNEYSISAGDFITDKLFISYTWNLNPTDKEEKSKWNIDYHLTPEIAVGYIHTTDEDPSWRLIYTFKF
jgi:autotransporter translocation and assembly factor TamB